MQHRRTVCEYMVEKQFATAPCRIWWLLAIVLLQWLDSVNVTFNALQVNSGVLSKQYNSLKTLLEELRVRCGATRDETADPDTPIASAQGIARMGQFSAPIQKFHDLCLGIDVESLELVRSMNTDEIPVYLRSIAIVYFVSLTGIHRIIQGRSSSSEALDAIPPCLPLEFKDTSEIDFVHLVNDHKVRLTQTLGNDFIREVCQQHKKLVHAMSTEPAIFSQISSSAWKGFSAAWSPAGSRFCELQQFAAGLATVMPTTSRVEGDFSLMKYRHNTYCAVLTDFALEGVMYAKQYNMLQDVANALQGC